MRLPFRHSDKQPSDVLWHSLTNSLHRGKRKTRSLLFGNRGARLPLEMGLELGFTRFLNTILRVRRLGAKRRESEKWKLSATTVTPGHTTGRYSS
jgi:hypothetical protein